MSPIVLLPGGRNGKYNSAPIELDGARFDSTGEASRWCELKYLEKSGQIMELERQVRFELHAGDRSQLRTIGAYVADFVYLEEIHTGLRDGWAKVVEDFKGHDTPLSRWKRRHLEAEYHLTVKVTHHGRR